MVFTAYNKLIGGFIICGIVGFTNLNKRMTNEEMRKVTKNMMLLKSDELQTDLYAEESICLGYKMMNGNSKSPTIFKYQGNTYLISFDGIIFNSIEIKNKLIDNGFKIEGGTDEEIVLKAYVFYGYNVVKHINGVFAFSIWNKNKKELFLTRDHLGGKPLFYSIKNNEIVFASEIKALFEFPSIYPCLNETGISELFGVGPAHSPGITPFKDVFELKPASFIIFNNNYLIKDKYWKLISKEHKDDFETTCDKVKYLLYDSIKKQIVSDKSICTFLSGGLDSSIVTKVVSDETGKINTFSVDYKDNDKNFIKNDFQPDSDNKYIDIMKKNLNTNHKRIVLDTPDLINSLEEAMIARDVPGMADVDSSLLMFCKKINNYAKVALTGECADELFAGYPWFFRSDALSSNTFPWSLNIQDRQNLLNKSIKNRIDLKEYVDYRYRETLSEVEFTELDSKDTKEKRKISYITMNWFMQTLIDRSERMSKLAGIEIRVPFCDYRIAEYLWNVPWEMKAYKGREKGLLRHIMKGQIPDEIVFRKKSPFPKTYNPSYLYSIKERLADVMDNVDAPIKEIIDEKIVREIINTDGRAYKRPWFGQLMTGPQLMAYLCQINMWLKKYQIRLDL